MKRGFRDAISLYICITYIWMCVQLTPAQLNGVYSYLVFQTLSALGHYPVNMSIQASKIGAFRSLPRYSMAVFMKMILTTRQM
jgi:hypothetical protein